MASTMTRLVVFAAVTRLGLSGITDVKKVTKYVPVYFVYPSPVPTFACYDCATATDGERCNDCCKGTHLRVGCHMCIAEERYRKDGSVMEVKRRCVNHPTFAVPPGCRKSDDRLSCTCFGKLCNGEKWKSFHYLSLRMPKGKMLPGEQQPRLLQGYRVTTSNVTLKEVKSGHSSTKSQNVQKAEVAIEKRKEKKQSLLGKVFWWWSNDSLD